jgi:NAD(P)-dependent dehydrogenase (short-subunit alcohol dehydrogenase family)
MTRFQDKIVLITGASSGIGEAAAYAFAREGAQLFLVARRSDRGEAVVEKIRAAGGTAVFHQADMADRKQIAGMVAACVARFGGLDVAFNNAGVDGAFNTDTPDYPEEAWDDLLAVNLTGVWFCMRHQIPAMLARGGGSIVNMASMAGVKGFPGSSGYAASKYGVVGITKAAALEYATRGIRVNAVCPAIIRSEMADRVFGTDQPDREAQAGSWHPMGRIGEPEEVADVVLWLASDQASFVTAEAVQIDGGYGA